MATINSRSLDLWKAFKTTVGASSTKVVDTVAVSSFDSAKYIIKISSISNTASKSLEMSVNYDGSSLKDVVSHKITTGMDVLINANLVSSNLELEIINNESFIVDVGIRRLIIN